MKVWEGNGIHEEPTFGEFFWKDVLITNKFKLWHISLIKVVGPSLEQKYLHMRQNIHVEWFLHN